jgi:hypothetical protein
LFYGRDVVFHINHPRKAYINILQHACEVLWVFRIDGTRIPSPPGTHDPSPSQGRDELTKGGMLPCNSPCQETPRDPNETVLCILYVIMFLCFSLLPSFVPGKVPSRGSENQVSAGWCRKASGEVPQLQTPRSRVVGFHRHRI